VSTNDDGACAVHSVFGKPIINDKGLGEIYCTDARSKAKAALGETYAQFRERVQDTFVTDAIKTLLWQDMDLPMVKATAQQSVSTRNKANVSHEARMVWKRIEKHPSLKAKCVKQATMQMQAARIAEENKVYCSWLSSLFVNVNINIRLLRMS